MDGLVHKNMHKKIIRKEEKNLITKNKKHKTLCSSLNCLMSIAPVQIAQGFVLNVFTKIPNNQVSTFSQAAPY